MNSVLRMTFPLNIDTYPIPVINIKNSYWTITENKQTRGLMIWNCQGY